MTEKRKDDPMAFTESCRDARAIVYSLKQLDPKKRVEVLQEHIKICPVCQKVLSTYFAAVLAEGEIGPEAPEREETLILARSGSGEDLPEIALTVQFTPQGGITISAAAGPVTIQNPLRPDDPEAEASAVISAAEKEGENKLPLAAEARFFRQGSYYAVRVRRIHSREDYTVSVRQVRSDGRDGERMGEARKLGGAPVVFSSLPPGRYRLIFLGKTRQIPVELALKAGRKT